MLYRDMILEAAGWERTRAPDRRWLGRFTVRALASPAGATAASDAVPVNYDYAELMVQLQRLYAGKLDRSDLIRLGRVLALMLLPPGPNGSQRDVRQLFADSLNGIGPDAGLRLRLQLPPELAGIPWEVMYVDRAGGGDGMDGFLALDPRVALVRHENLSVPPPLPAVPGLVRVVAALASPVDLPALDLAREEAALSQALAGEPGIQLDVIRNANLAEVQAKVAGATVFHFTGHGVFDTEAGTPSAPGMGYLAFEDEYVDAERVGINLRGNGIRLAVLGGCDTGRRDASGLNSVWSSVALALVKAEVPAVVANQHHISENGAIVFSKMFYRALSGGLPIERAVAAGRIGAYNANPSGHDWTAPVLYLRAADGKLFAGAADPAVRREAQRKAEVAIRVRQDAVAAGGEVLGARVHEVVEGKLSVQVDVAETVHGHARGLELGQVSGGNIDVDMHVGTVGSGGRVVGVEIDSLG